MSLSGRGYPDPAVLWRLAGYLAWLGQRHHEQVVIGTVIYLTPSSDAGDTLRQTVDGRDLLAWQVPVVHLWELDALDAAQHGSLGLAVLSPLMHGATVALVEQVVSQVLTEAPLTQQADLLSILGIFSEPLMDSAGFVRLVGREKLMSSDLISYLVGEKVAELEQDRAAMYRALQDAVADTVVLRFPNTPAFLVRHVQFLNDLDQLVALRRAILQAPDQPAVEALLAALSTEG